MWRNGTRSFTTGKENGRTPAKKEPLCAVKFCGGCRATYDRTAALETLRQLCPGLPFRTGAEAQTGAAAGLLLCGCSAQCIRADQADGGVRWLLLDDPKQAASIAAALRALVRPLP